MSTLDWSAAVSAVAVLGFHVRRVTACAVPTSGSCKQTKMSSGSLEFRMYALSMALALVLIPLALAGTLSRSTLGISMLVTCVAATTWAFVTGCYTAKNKQSIVCRAKIEELLGLASCVCLIAVILQPMLGTSLEYSPTMTTEW